MKFRSDRHIRHNGKEYEPGVVDLPREVGERLRLDPFDGPSKEELEAKEKERREAKEQKEREAKEQKEREAAGKDQA